MYLSADEAAKTLGVSVSTLYAYVSRKKIRSQPVPGSKNRKYWKGDILTLLGETPTVTRDVLTATTEITLVNESGPFYRGRDALQLAETATIEDVAGLLWETDPAEAFAPCPFTVSEAYTRVHQALEGATTTEQVMSLLPVLERGNARAYDLSKTGYVRNAAEIMRWMAGMIVGSPNPGTHPLHVFIGQSVGKGEAYADLVRRLLVLAADHELDPTTYAVRAVANGGATAYQVAIVGLASSTGRRLTFGRVQSLSRLLDEILGSTDPAEPIMRRLREGEPLPGFSSSIYPSGDPRAASLLRAIEAALAGDQDIARLGAATRVVADATGRSPDFALPVVYISRKLGLASAEGLLFRLGRYVGWIAHAMEQYHTRELVRSHALYTGILPERGDGHPAARGTLIK